MPAFLATTDSSIDEQPRQVIISFPYRADPEFREVTAEARANRGKRYTAMFVGKKAPDNAHIVYARQGYVVYEVGWSIIERLKRVIETSADRVARAKGAVNPMLFVIAETERLVLLRLLNHQATETEKKWYQELLEIRLHMLETGMVGKNVNACFNVCKALVEEIDETNK